MRNVSRHTRISADNDKRHGKYCKAHLDFTRQLLETWEMLVGTPGFEQTIINFMGNISRHTWFSAGIDKIHGKCW